MTITMSRKKQWFKLERCMNKDEWQATKEAKGLVPRNSPHEKQPKWVADLGTRQNCNILGKSTNYSHKAVFFLKEGCYEWIKAHEQKPENEPGSYAIPVDLLDRFNECIKKIYLCQKKTAR